MILLSEGSNSSQGIESNAPLVKSSNIRFILVNFVLGLLAVVAGYLEFYSYPSLLASYGESDLSLHVSFLTYSYNVNKCYAGTCTHLIGVPSFDFFQLFIYAMIVYTLLQFLKSR